MAIDERARHELFTQAESALGASAAETLMALLPPVGWADVATKTDLVQLETRLELRFELSEQRMLATFRNETRTLLFAMIGVMIAFGSAVVAAIKL